jgi:hypothetical protein
MQLLYQLFFKSVGEENYERKDGTDLEPYLLILYNELGFAGANNPAVDWTITHKTMGICWHCS